MKIKITYIYKTHWEIIIPRICHHLKVGGFNNYIAIVNLTTYSWCLWSHPECLAVVAEGKCETLKDGKKQVKDKMKELDML